MGHITFLDPSRTGFLTVQPYAARATEVKGRPGRIEHLSAEVPDSVQGLKLLANLPGHMEARRLENAHSIVVGGAGLDSIENFALVRELAAAMGAELGATHPPVLEHWMEEERLIGQTGKSVRPKLLFSIGTSGAVQYAAGIMESQTVSGHQPRQIRSNLSDSRFWDRSRRQSPSPPSDYPGQAGYHAKTHR